jgi:hypothetical protein
MKKFVFIVLMTVGLSSVVPSVEGIEPDEEKALRHATEPSAQERRVRANDPAEIAKLITDINSAARKNKQRIISIIVINTDVAGSTLEQEMAQTGMTLGDVYVAHSLALATKKKVGVFFALHKNGKSWSEIAKSHNVSLKGSTALIKEMQSQ